MEVSTLFKSMFVQKLLLGLQQNILPSELSERKKAILLLSNVALACARHDAIWSQALIATISVQDTSNGYISTVLSKDAKSFQKFHPGPRMSARLNKKRKCPKIRFAHKRTIASSALGRRVQKTRTDVLRSLVPGGEFMDAVSLLEQTTDYIVSLRAQVDIMQRLAKGLEACE